MSAGYFRVVGLLLPLLGREFQRDEDVQGGAPVCILSFGLWKTAFNGDPSVVGRSTTLRGQDFTVVGVLPDGFPVTQRTSFSGGEGVDIDTPLRAVSDSMVKAAASTTASSHGSEGGRDLAAGTGGRAAGRRPRSVNVPRAASRSWGWCPCRRR